MFFLSKRLIFLLTCLHTFLFSSAQALKVFEGDTSYFKYDTISRKSRPYLLKNNFPDGDYLITTAKGEIIRKETLRDGMNHIYKITTKGDIQYKPINMIDYYPYPRILQIRDTTCAWERIPGGCEVAPVRYEYHPNGTKFFEFRHLTIDTLNGILEVNLEKRWYDTGVLKHFGETKIYVDEAGNKKLVKDFFEEWDQEGMRILMVQRYSQRKKYITKETYFKNNEVDKTIEKVRILRLRRGLDIRKEYINGSLKHKEVKKRGVLILNKDYQLQ